MQRVVRRVVHAQLFWFLGVIMAAVPIMVAAADQATTQGFGHAHDAHYKDILIFTLVVVGIGVSDAAQTMRFCRPHAGMAYFGTLLLFAMAVFFGTLFYYFGRHSVTSIPPVIWPNLFFLSMVGAFIARFTGELGLAMEEMGHE